LERRVNEGIGNVIRIGGQSKSAILERKNLRLRAQLEAKKLKEAFFGKHFQGSRNVER
jgi:hypothetical protein